MSFKFHCFHCGQRISALDEDQETEATCPGCGRKLMVPCLVEGELVAPRAKVSHAAPSSVRRTSSLVVGILIALIILLTGGVAVLLRDRGEAKPTMRADPLPAAKKIAVEEKPKTADAEPVESEPPADLPPPELEQVLGGSRMSVHALLGDWREQEGRRIPPDKQMVLYTREVDLIATYQNDRAIGVVVTTRTGEPPLTKSEYFQMIRLVGQAAAPEDIKREEDGIVEFSVGEN